MTKEYITDCGNTTVLAGEDVPDVFHLTASAIERVQSLLESEEDGTLLRIGVSSGGCAGFQHLFGFETEITDDDHIISGNQQNLVVIDPLSMEYLKDSTLEYVKAIDGEFFKISNPHLTSKCGCEKSFGM